MHIKLHTVGLLALVSSAFAHSTTGSGFSTGLLHPLMGADHPLTMVLVGFLAYRHKQYALPLAFMAAFTAGLYVPLAGGAALEGAVWASLALLAAQTLRSKPQALWLSVALAGVMHGSAHGNELAMGNLTALGILSSSALLHMAGMWLARATQQRNA